MAIIGAIEQMDHGTITILIGIIDIFPIRSIDIHRNRRYPIRWNGTGYHKNKATVQESEIDAITIEHDIPFPSRLTKTHDKLSFIIS